MMIRRHHWWGLVLGLLASTTVAGQSEGLPDCEWCGADEAPEELASTITIAGPEEPGRRLTLTGTVYQPDGETPAPGVMLYVYHTNAEGEYPTRGDEMGNAQRHGYLRGWLVTDGQGRYTVHTIKPGSYPGRITPAHIHITVTEPNRSEYWIDSVWFEGDPKITDETLEWRSGKGGPAIVELIEAEDGTLRVRKDIILEPGDGDD